MRGSKRGSKLKEGMCGFHGGGSGGDIKVIGIADVRETIFMSLDSYKIALKLIIY